ncbi:MAG: 50S ribosomal protein L29 [Anaerolineales bacterium]|jgi:large subunit ribosomal protein L29
MMPKTEEIRSLATEEIRARIEDAREELLRLRFQQATGELTDHNRLRYTRREIARMLTVIGERERLARMEGEE